MDWTDKTILIIGGDQRLLYLADLLKGACKQVRTYALDGAKGLQGIELCENLEESMQGTHIVVAPVPFTKDGVHLLTKENTTILLSDFSESLVENGILFGGNIPSVVLEGAKQKNVQCYDFMKMEDVALENAITTAEGAIAEAITLSTQNVNQENCLILGYGRCAKAIAERLHGFHAKVTIAARRKEARLEAFKQGYFAIPLEEIDVFIPNAQFIFNTIPAMVLDEVIMETLQSDAVIIDIASAPGGTDFDACKRLGIIAKLSLGIPGRYSPKTSAHILLRGMLSSLK
ncbi:dipicolinate synthase subunit DpsA [Anaerotignum sp. MB30-C6]|uniref:dipicolinate synthase subunit DpsA n=1 Tax=Anaerotignum sp. MB30-C6 TaxID=3070814 RepID=UPI0027DC4609|nr:dipicolinate synthase subunit DpsA [Anaerotignum sp. MB30-C6]WMI80097.1 dipicolinate synthase subunit DpsA [Anaerotignum sp. MB30-C6]